MRHNRTPSAKPLRCMGPCVATGWFPHWSGDNDPPSKIQGLVNTLSPRFSVRLTSQFGMLLIHISCLGLQENLIRRGYIPKEFVPAFKSESLANARSILGGGASTYPQPENKCCYHSIPKFKHFRRLIAFPNPLHQSLLAGILEAQWRRAREADVQVTDLVEHDEKGSRERDRTQAQD